MAKAKSDWGRKLEDTSWLAQCIKDTMDSEFAKNGHTTRWNSLNTLHIIVNEADNEDNDNIYYSINNYVRSIVICEIPSLIEHGSDFNLEGMRGKLRALAENYKDFNGHYLVSISTTHDLNTCTINDISELLFQIDYK